MHKVYSIKCKVMCTGGAEKRHGHIQVAAGTEDTRVHRSWQTMMGYRLWQASLSKIQRAQVVTHTKAYREAQTPPPPTGTPLGLIILFFLRN